MLIPLLVVTIIGLLWGNYTTLTNSNRFADRDFMSIWTGGKAQFWLAVPTSNIAFVFLPIAYISFAFLLNQKKLLGDAMPKGRARWIWNLLVWPSAGLAAIGSVWKLWSGLGWFGIAILVGAVALCGIVHVGRSGTNANSQP